VAVPEIQMPITVIFALVILVVAFLTPAIFALVRPAFVRVEAPDDKYQSFKKFSRRLIRSR